MGHEVAKEVNILTCGKEYDKLAYRTDESRPLMTSFSHYTPICHLVN